MDSKLIKQLLLYSLPLLAYVVLTYAQTNTQDEPATNGGPSINIIEYPESGPHSAGESGYIATYYALQKLGIELGKDPKQFLLKSKTPIKQARLAAAVDAQVQSDLTDFFAKKAVPADSPIPGISSQAIKEIIMSTIPAIAQRQTQEYIQENFKPTTGELHDNTLSTRGAELFTKMVTILREQPDDALQQYNETWSRLEPYFAQNNFQLLKDFTGLRDVSVLEVTKKEVLGRLHKLFNSERNADSESPTGYWLSADELTSIINQYMPDRRKVLVLQDMGLLKTPGDSDDRIHEIEQIFGTMKRIMNDADQGTQTFIIDKAYVRGTPNQNPIWVPIIINKHGGQLRIVIIDPENQIKTDNPYVQILLKQLS